MKREGAGETIPVIGVPIGDPNGIGPEVAVKAALALKGRDVGVLLIGDEWVVPRAAELAGAADAVAVEVCTDAAKAREAAMRGHALTVLDVPRLRPDELSPGVVSISGGKATLAYLDTAIELAAQGVVDGIACAPANKEAMRLAGSPFNGQTELIAAAFGVRRVGTVLVAGPFRVFDVTGHVSLARACAMVTRDRVLATIRSARNVLSQDFGIEDPWIAVLGLNPHSGDGGLLGSEEQEHIIPAIEQARAEGIRVDGPLPGDTAYLTVRRMGHDGVVAMYHDQANAVPKFAASEVVTVTVGLPIVRTTVGHGTAFDIAWQGKASPACMVSAIEVAAELARVRRRRAGSRSVG